jgi:hypothetical protein
MKFFVSCSMAALMGVAAILWAGPVGAASAEERPAPGVGSASAAAKADHAASVAFRVGAGMSLGEPTTNLNQRTEALDYVSDVGKRSAGYTVAFNDWQPGTEDFTIADVSWPILQGKDRVKTDFTLSARLQFRPIFGLGLDTTRPPTVPGYGCEVKDVKGQISDRIHCWMERHGWDNDWDLHLTDDDVNRRAEVSGSFRTEGSVSLEKGTFSGEELHVKGAEAVHTGESTQFDAVRQRFESPTTTKEANIGFLYSLYDGGQPVRSKVDGSLLRVTGGVSNYAGPFWFTGDSKCFFINERGLPVEDSGYSCAMNGHYVQTSFSDGRVHYITDFVVSRNK